MALPLAFLPPLLLAARVDRRVEPEVRDKALRRRKPADVLEEDVGDVAPDLRIRPVPPLGDAQREDPRVGVHADQSHVPALRLILIAHCVILCGAATYWSRRVLQGCIHVYGEFSPKQVVSAGAQTQSRVMNPGYKSSFSHASQQMVTSHLLSRIILQYVADFYPV